MEQEPTFFKRIQTALEARGITIGQVEQEGEMAIVFHIPAEQNDEVRAFQEAFQKEHNVMIAISDEMGGMNVLIVEGGEQEVPEDDGKASEPTNFDEAPSEELEESQEGDTAVEDGVPLDETIKSYRILGLVDYVDEQGNIRGQLEIGSVAEMPAYIGDLAVEDGRAEEVQ